MQLINLGSHHKVKASKPPVVDPSTLETQVICPEDEAPLLREDRRQAAQESRKPIQPCEPENIPVSLEDNLFSLARWRSC